jgi:peptidoglycan hydrolase CwlO-like protein
MNGVISMKTLLPFSVVIIIVGVTLHFAGIKAIAASNEKSIAELKKSKSNIYNRINEVEKHLYKIEGKIDLLLKDN